MLTYEQAIARIRELLDAWGDDADANHWDTLIQIDAVLDETEKEV